MRLAILSQFFSILAAPLLAQALDAPSAQEIWQTDAFGLFTQGSDPERAAWSGVVTTPHDDGQSVIVAGPPEELTLFAGPKSQLAGGKPVHLVAMGFDAVGNLLPDGTVVQLISGEGGRETVPSRGGIAALLHQPDPVAGPRASAAQSGWVQSPRATWRVVADVNSLTPQIRPADPVKTEVFVDMETQPLRDRFGNLAEDGATVPLWLVDSQGRGAWVMAQTLGGVARARLLTREMSGRVDGTLAAASGGQSEFGLDVMALQSAGPLRLRSTILSDIEAVQVIAGPFLTEAGHMLNDGAEVVFTLAGEDESLGLRDYRTWTTNGHSEALFVLSKGAKTMAVTVQSPLGRAQFRVPVDQPSDLRSEVLP